MGPHVPRGPPSTWLSLPTVPAGATLAEPAPEALGLLTAAPFTLTLAPDGPLRPAERVLLDVALHEAFQGRAGLFDAAPPVLADMALAHSLLQLTPQPAGAESAP